MKQVRRGRVARRDNADCTGQQGCEERKGYNDRWDFKDRRHHEGYPDPNVTPLSAGDAQRLPCTNSPRTVLHNEASS
jgi:hypothetical protein